ncbi:M20 aminoacylase family protein [Castellaniella caeni]|uniref:M20 aminoacylase family protein n=1 Tax=Castellaniella caeni TaxID=266123 RepID=UPI000B21A300|nr:M20 aminoacylase family protein [Castellaniella caeni]
MLNPDIAALAEEMAAWRRDIHQHPELAFDEHRTSAKVAGLLRAWGLEVHEGFGETTAVIAVLRGNLGAGRSLGLRADMDALPMDEQTGVDYRSVHEHVFHGCGHDGHTAILLGAAKYLATHRDFAGTVNFIFQPAEETLAGGLALMRAGLFERFPCDEIYALHNNNCIALGQVGVRVGAILSACDWFRIHITGVGTHSAMPHKGVDPIVAGAALVQSLQSVVSRNVDPLDVAVLSVCQFHAGTAINVIPGTAQLEGTLRTLSPTARQVALDGLQRVCDGIAATHGCGVRFEHLQSSPATVNASEQTDVVRQAAAAVLGADQVIDCPPLMASEDFAYMLQQRPGAYFFLGHNGLTCHHPGFDFDDDTLSTGVALFAEIVRQRLG